MSVGGTVASLVGGGFVGVLTAMTLVLENVKCSEEWGSVLLETVGWGVCAGGVGSLVRSRPDIIIKRYLILMFLLPTDRLGARGDNSADAILEENTSGTTGRQQVE